MSEYNPTLLDFQRKVAEWARSGKPSPLAGAFDPEAFPFGKDAGANKLGLKVCATCAKPPTPTGRNDCPEAFLFRDEISAREYYISAMCQACQDSVFAADEDEDQSDE